MTPTQLPVAIRPSNLPEVIELARHLCRAEGMIPKAFVGHIGKIVAAILKADELGVGAMTGLSSIHVVEGKAVADYSFWIARLKHFGYRIKWETSTSAKAILRLTAPDGETHVEIWDEARAKRAGLWGRRGPWSAYPDTMLRARCVTSAGRSFAAEVMTGCYTPDEAEEFVQAMPTTVRDASPDTPDSNGHQEPPQSRVAALADRVARQTSDPEIVEPEQTSGSDEGALCFDFVEEAYAAIDQANTSDRLQEVGDMIRRSGFAHGADDLREAFVARQVLLEQTES